MSFIDSMIAAVSPKKAYEREAWRQGLEAMRGYDAAGFGRINSGWRAHNESAEITDRYSRDVVRARARDLERNSDILQAVVLAYKRNVVGKGFTLRARTGDDDLNRQIEKLWRQWCKARNCDVTGEQSFTEILRMAVERKKVDGGILFLFRHTPGGVVPFKLQAIEVDELDVSRSAPRHRGNRWSRSTRRSPPCWWAGLNIIPGAGRWATGSSNMIWRGGACCSRSTLTPRTPIS